MVPWDMVIVDEAHRLKNSKSKLYTTLSEEVTFGNCLLLTGTPIQNDVGELHTLLHVLDTVRFADKNKFL